MTAPAERLADLPYAAALRPHAGGLKPGGQYDTEHFDRLTLDQPDGVNAVFLECAFSQVTMHGGQLRQARLTDVWLSGARLTSVDLTGSSWLDVCFLGGFAAGIEAPGSALRRVRFQDCKLDGVNFCASELTEVAFGGCLLRGVDFSGARLTRVTFSGSRLARADFTSCALAEVDLRGAELDIVAGPAGLRGAIITPGQLTALAPALAESLGIRVEEERGPAGKHRDAVPPADR